LPRGCHSRIKIKKNLTARRSRHRAAKAAKTQKNKMCPDFRLITLFTGSDGRTMLLSCGSSAGDHFLIVGGGQVEHPEFPPGYAHQRCVEEGYPDGY